MSKNLERALVILNPWSGRGHGERAREELARLLRATQSHYDIVETERPGHAIDLARAGRLSGYGLVVAAGGDGTISEVVNGLLLANESLVEDARAAALEAHLAAAHQRELAAAAKAAEAAAAASATDESAAENASENPAAGDADAVAPEFSFITPPELEVAGTLGVVPVGSGNDFATMVGIPLDMEAAVKLLERRRLRLVDVGSAEVVCAPGTAADGGAHSFHRYFDNNMGIGLEASVILESNKIRRLRRLRGLLLYAMAAIRTIVKNRSPRMTIKWRTQAGEEGSHDKPTLLVSVGNSPRAGGGFFLTPDAEVDDKQLDVAIADDLPRPQVMALLPRAMRGTHTNHPAVTMLRIEKLTIAVPDGAPVQMDGELVHEHACEVQITVLPHKLELIA